MPSSEDTPMIPFSFRMVRMFEELARDGCSPTLHLTCSEEDDENPPSWTAAIVDQGAGPTMSPLCDPETGDRFLRAFGKTPQAAMVALHSVCFQN